MIFSKLILVILLLKCKFGFHKFDKKPTLSNLDTYGLQGGNECSICKYKHISFSEASTLCQFSYNRGTIHQNTKSLSYGKGINNIVALYGKEYVQNMLDKIEK